MQLPFDIPSITLPQSLTTELVDYPFPFPLTPLTIIIAVVIVFIGVILFKRSGILFPITKISDLDSNARNWPGYIVVDPDTKFKTAVWAQEAYEAKFKLNPLNLFATVFSKKAKAKMEFMGHAVEVSTMKAVYGYNDAQAIEYRAKEARSMNRGYKGLFKDYSVEDIIVAMEELDAKADKWVSKNMKSIMKFKEKYDSQVILPEN